MKRIKRWINYLLVRFVPGTSKLAVMEAKRLSEHIFDNYDEHQQLIILDELKSNLIEMRQNQIKNKQIHIITSNSELRVLQSNLEKLLVK
jgi:hypothetical protein